VVVREGRGSRGGFIADIVVWNLMLMWALWFLMISVVNKIGLRVGNGVRANTRYGTLNEDVASLR
jgi:hypothetical protein